MLRKLVSWVDEAAFLLLVVFLIPVGILIVGAPIALVLRFVVSLVDR